MDKKNTYFVDLDGTVFKYRKFDSYKETPVEVIKSTLDYLKRAKKEGHKVIITTARPNYLYNHTVKELVDNDVPFDYIIMDLERGPRYLINDMDPLDNEPRAIAINLIRDNGLQS